ncbi:hypothetical protein Ancab_007530 [Ancistrocladus abbreviatus]
MAVSQFTAALAMTITIISLARIQPVECSVVKAHVSCIDCGRHYDLSGIIVTIQCDKVKKMAITSTEHNGSFEAQLPTDFSLPPTSNCQAKVLGGPKQLYALEENKGSKIITKQGKTNVYTTLAPLIVAESCTSFRKYGRCSSPDGNLGSSKTINLPVPPEFGLPPTSFYIPIFPIFPIIGIP